VDGGHSFQSRFGWLDLRSRSSASQLKSETSSRRVYSSSGDWYVAKQHGARSRGYNARQRRRTAALILHGMPANSHIDIGDLSTSSLFVNSRTPLHEHVVQYVVQQCSLDGHRRTCCATCSSVSWIVVQHVRNWCLQHFRYCVQYVRVMEFGHEWTCAQQRGRPTTCWELNSST